MTKEFILKSLVIAILFLLVIGGCSILPILIPALLSSFVTLLPFIGLIVILFWLGNLVCNKL